MLSKQSNTSNKLASAIVTDSKILLLMSPPHQDLNFFYRGCLQNHDLPLEQNSKWEFNDILFVCNKAKVKCHHDAWSYKLNPCIFTNHVTCICDKIIPQIVQYKLWIHNLLTGRLGILVPTMSREQAIYVVAIHNLRNNLQTNIWQLRFYTSIFFVWISPVKIGIQNNWNTHIISPGTIVKRSFPFIVGKVPIGDQPVLVARWRTLPKYSMCHTSENSLWELHCTCVYLLSHRNVFHWNQHDHQQYR